RTATTDTAQGRPLMRRAAVSCCVVLITASLAGAGPVANGWRGNGTGLWPDATPPLERSRPPQGALDGLRARAARPTGDRPREAPLVEKGQLRDWLVLGPFALKDSVADFDRDLLGGEADAQPTLRQKVGELTWAAASVPPDDFMVFGTAELPWLDVGKVVG